MSETSGIRSIPESSLETAAEHVKQSQRLVVLTGAGMSAESGVPTFRDALSGYWSRYRPEDLATREAFERNPGGVWAWYEARRQQLQRLHPNAGHLALATWQQHHSLTLITQNVDDLHERAGSRNVIHVHGHLNPGRCLLCEHTVTLPPFPDTQPHQGRDPDYIEPPRCSECGGMIRPGVVWFGELLPEQELLAAEICAREADLLIAVGTSGLVYPVAGLPWLTRECGGRVAIVNPQPSALDDCADWIIRGTAADVLPRLFDPS